MIYVNVNNVAVQRFDCEIKTRNIKVFIEQKYGLPSTDYYVLQNGKKLVDEDVINSGNVECVLRLLGGKGGFGSMLRAIGAQIEKTTNREACRDLSGRRLRDINEEKRLKNWIESQAERDREAAERKQKKLERLCAKPKHEFKDPKYEQLRSELPDMVMDAVEQGFKASTSGGKRKQPTSTQIKPKKRKLWLDEDLSCSDEELSDEDGQDNSDHSDSKTSNVSLMSSTTSNVSEMSSKSGSLAENSAETKNLKTVLAE